MLRASGELNGRCSTLEIPKSTDKARKYPAANHFLSPLRVETKERMEDGIHYIHVHISLGDNMENGRANIQGYQYLSILAPRFSQ